MDRPFRIVPRRELGAEAWNACADRLDEAWLWHRAEIIEALSFWTDYEDASFAILDEAGRLLALVPLHRVVYRKWRGLARMVRYESQGGFAIDRAHGERRCRQIRDAIVAHLDGIAADADCVDMRLTPMSPAWRGADAPRVNPLLAAGFVAVQAQSWVIDLAAAPDDIRRRYSHGARQELRKAEGMGGTLREATAADLGACHALHLETYRRTGARPVPLDTFRVIFERVLPLGFARVLVYERGGVMIAAHTTGIYKHGACYWNGASRDERSGGENRLLFDAQIMAARDVGCVAFDAGDAFPGAADGKDKGLSDFKGSFGGTLMPVWRGRRDNQQPAKRLLRAAQGARLILTGRG